MPLTTISIKNYRSVADITFPVHKLTVFVGKNGVGKTNLYQAMRLLHCAAIGTITRDIANEGGLSSVMWAGPRKRHDQARIMLEVELDDLTYAIEIGFPRSTDAALEGEPMVKEECLTLRTASRPVIIMKRKGPSVMIRGKNGKMAQHKTLLPSETALSSIRGHRDAPEIDRAQFELEDWRFYHDFRTDRQSPVRQPCKALCTPTLSSDGQNLAAVLATVYNISADPDDIHEAIEDAFSGSHLDIEVSNGLASLALAFPHEFPDADPPINRPYRALELSDGTLRYLCLVGALLSYRLPNFIALNEPEASLHPDLIGPLARLIKKAAFRTNIWVVTHSEQLAVQLSEETGIIPREVIRAPYRNKGATWLKGLKLTGQFQDNI
jgi:predicted ATPase